MPYCKKLVLAFIRDCERAIKQIRMEFHDEKGSASAFVRPLGNCAERAINEKASFQHELITKLIFIITGFASTLRLSVSRFIYNTCACQYYAAFQKIKKKSIYREHSFARKRNSEFSWQFLSMIENIAMSREREPNLTRARERRMGDICVAKLYLVDIIPGNWREIVKKYFPRARPTRHRRCVYMVGARQSCRNIRARGKIRGQLQTHVVSPSCQSSIRGIFFSGSIEQFYASSDIE